MTDQQDATKKTSASAGAIDDDNPKDDEAVQEQTKPNDSLRADEIIAANNFLGDL